MNNTHENTATDPGQQRLVVDRLTPPHRLLPAGSGVWFFAKKVGCTDRIPEGIGNIPFWDFKA